MISEELVKQAAQEEENAKIYKVDLNNRSITRIGGLKPFSKLRCLQLNFNRIRCIENLDCLPDLRQLHLQYNQLNSIEGLQNNKVLTVLSLSHNRIQKIQNIGHLSKLESLYIDNNCIEKITGLQCCKDLKNLSLSCNKLASIESLPAFSKLETLIANNNNISKISASLFSKCTKLIKLDLANNQIRDISFINNLNSLEWLNLQNNKIELLKVTPLRSLEYLNVNQNAIETLPNIGQTFPELSALLFAHNQIMSEYGIISAVAQAEMLVEIDYRGNPMETPEFQDTLFKVYGFDRINEQNFSKEGTRYLSMAQNIAKTLNRGDLRDVEDDEESRKIKMSGFYNESLEAEISGVKPDRPSSARKKMVMNLNYNDIEKNYQQIVENNRKIETMRNQCKHIFEQNGIQIKMPAQVEQDQSGQPEKALFQTELKANQRPSPGTTLSELQNKNEESKNKWKELKNRQKNFNIRGVVRRASGSARKGNIKDGSTSNLPGLNERPELMRTQLNPPRWNNDPNLAKTLQYRPLSAKKTSK